MIERDLETEGEDIESFESVDAFAVLSEPVGECAVVIEDADIEEVEDPRDVGVEAVVAWSCEEGFVVWAVVDRLLGVFVEFFRVRCSGLGDAGFVVIERCGVATDIWWGDDRFGDQGIVVAGSDGVGLGVVLSSVADGLDRSDFCSQAVGEDGGGVLVSFIDW